MSLRVDGTQFRQLESDFEVLFRPNFIPDAFHRSKTLDLVGLLGLSILVMTDPDLAFESRCNWSARVATFSGGVELTLRQDDRKTVGILD